MTRITYIAQPTPRIVIIQFILLPCGFALLLFPWFIPISTGFRRKMGAVVFSGAILAAVSLWQFLTTVRGCPRLELSPSRLTIRWLATTQSAAWTSLDAFQIEPRPFGQDFQNDVISAKLIGPDIHRAFKQAGKIAIDARYYKLAPQTLCADLNAARKLALGNPPG
jgi:hypothetical protein